MDSTRNGRQLIAGFAFLAVAATAVVVALVGGGITELLVALGGGAVVSILAIGVYALGTRMGQPHSHAVATTTVFLGVLYMAGLVARFLTRFGA